MMVRDGVTSAFELEVGTADVAEWYAAREGGQIVNYGVSIGHIPARMKVLGDPGTGLLPAGIGGSGTATEAQMAAMESHPPRRTGPGRGRRGIRQRVYAGGADGRDRADVPRRRRRRRVGAHPHAGRAVAGLHETISGSRTAGAQLHIVHVNSSAANRLDGFLARDPGGARRRAGRDDRGLPVRGRDDGDPVGAVRRLGDVARRARFAQHQLVSTGERLTRKTFAEARQKAAR